MKQILLPLTLLLAFFTASCRSAPEKHYPVQAEVVSVDVPKSLIIVKHGDIPGLMPAMTMQYAVADPRQIENLQPGDKITADLVVSESKGRLEKITLVSKGSGKPSDVTTQHIP
jgi:Cu/Ag efflux protein CusF